MATDDGGLAMFDVSREAVRPLLSSLRLVNCAADALFYNVGELHQALAADGLTVVTASQRHARDAVANVARREAIATHIVNLGALANPEGVILIIDAHFAPYVTRYADVKDFLGRETVSAASASGASCARSPSPASGAPRWVRRLSPGTSPPR